MCKIAVKEMRREADHDLRIHILRRETHVLHSCNNPIIVTGSEGNVQPCECRPLVGTESLTAAIIKQPESWSLSAVFLPWNKEHVPYHRGGFGIPG